MFLQLRVPGYDIMGCGEAKSKEDAQEKAAEMFCNLLVENGLVDKKELSGDSVKQNLAITGTPSGGYFPPPRPPAPSHFLPPPPHQFQSNFYSNMGLLTGNCLSTSAQPRQHSSHPSLPPPPLAAHPSPSSSGLSMISNYGG